MVTLTVRGRERDARVTRTVVPTIRPRLDYRLTTLGHTAQRPVAALGAWAFANFAAVENARLEAGR
jgi:DNA-binding HxlR family transcriptional regulator